MVQEDLHKEREVDWQEQRGQSSSQLVKGLLGRCKHCNGTHAIDCGYGGWRANKKVKMELRASVSGDSAEVFVSDAGIHRLCVFSTAGSTFVLLEEKARGMGTSDAHLGSRLQAVVQFWCVIRGTTACMRCGAAMACLCARGAGEGPGPESLCIQEELRGSRE